MCAARLPAHFESGLYPSTPYRAETSWLTSSSPSEHTGSKSETANHADDADKPCIATVIPLTIDAILSDPTETRRLLSFSNKRQRSASLETLFAILRFEALIHDATNELLFMQREFFHSTTFKSSSIPPTVIAAMSDHISRDLFASLAEVQSSFHSSKVWLERAIEVEVLRDYRRTNVAPPSNHEHYHTPHPQDSNRID
jgi:hypothetical protein